MSEEKVHPNVARVTQAARDVEAAVAKDLATRGDAKRSTTQVGDALLALL